MTDTEAIPDLRPYLEAQRQEDALLIDALRNRTVDLARQVLLWQTATQEAQAAAEQQQQTISRQAEQIATLEQHLNGGLSDTTEEHRESDTDDYRGARDD